MRVITDQRLYDKVDMAARFMEGIHSRIRVEIQTLPGEGPERETEIEKLRTEIMAGKGPDVYLLESDQDNIAEVRSYLLEIHIRRCKVALWLRWMSIWRGILTGEQHI